jgi:hypothetical protein
VTRVPKCADNDGGKKDHEASGVGVDYEALRCRTLRAVGLPFWTTCLLLKIAEIQIHGGL